MILYFGAKIKGENLMNEEKRVRWNKGLTKETDKRLKKLSESLMGEKNPNYGKKQLKEIIEKRRVGTIRFWDSPEGTVRREEMRIKMSGKNSPSYGKHFISPKKGRYIIDLDLEEIKRQYFNEKKSITSISNFFDCSEDTIKKRLINAGVVLRTKNELGHPQTEESKKKMSETRIRNHLPGFKKGNENPLYGKFGKDHPKFGTVLPKKTVDDIKNRRATQILPVKDTKIEIKIQNFLKELNIPFKKHEYIPYIPNTYQCDILIPETNTVIECDGDYWHNYPKLNAVDRLRTIELEQVGFRVIRLWERDIKKMTIDEFQNKLL